MDESMENRMVKGYLFLVKETREKEFDREGKGLSGRRLG